MTIPYNAQTRWGVGYKGTGAKNQTLEERDLAKMLVKYEWLAYPYKQVSDFLVERVKWNYIRLYYHDVLFREWKWGSGQIDCFFEQKSEISLTTNEVAYMASTEINSEVDRGYFYAPYLPLSFMKKLYKLDDDLEL